MSNSRQDVIFTIWSDEKKMKRVPFSIEIRIFDERGKRIFTWRNGHKNLLKGIKAAENFIEEKLGIDIESEAMKRDTFDTPEQYREEEKPRSPFVAYSEQIDEVVLKLFGVEKKR